MKIYTVIDLAELLRVNPETIKRAVRKARFPAPQRVGRKWRWHEDVISSWLKEPHMIPDMEPRRRGRPRG